MIRPLAVLVWIAVLSTPVLAQNVAQDGLFIGVPNPITSTAVDRIRGQIEPRQNSRPVKTIVFDFNPGGKDVLNTDFGACLNLSDLITKQRANANTVAFIHGAVSGHTLLPALACKEIAMSKDAKLGKILTEGVPSLDNSTCACVRRGEPQVAMGGRSQNVRPERRLGLGLLETGRRRQQVVHRSEQRSGAGTDRGSPAGRARRAARPGRVLQGGPGAADRPVNVVLEKGTPAEIAEAYNLLPTSSR